MQDARLATKQHLFERSPEELYDIVRDPQETKNLIFEKQYKYVADQMRNDLDHFRKRTNDPWIEVDEQNAPI